MGASYADPSGKPGAGKSYIVFEAWGDRSGFSVSSAGDVNGDGLDDLPAFGLSLRSAYLAPTIKIPKIHIVR